MIANEDTNIMLINKYDLLKIIEKFTYDKVYQELWKGGVNEYKEFKTCISQKRKTHIETI